MVEQKSVAGKRVYLVEDHHHVLLPWGRECIRAGMPLRTLTLDHHTDTLPAFTHEFEISGVPYAFSCDDWRQEAILCKHLEVMRHDEHIDYATRVGMVDSAVLFTHVNYSISRNPAIRIIQEPPQNEEKETLKRYYGQALESKFLTRNLLLAGFDSYPQEGFLLDLDLDYFKTPNSFEPADSEVFYELIRRCCAITISRERDWVRLLNMDFDRRVTSEVIESAILRHIRSACGYSG